MKNHVYDSSNEMNPAALWCLLIPIATSKMLAVELERDQGESLVPLYTRESVSLSLSLSGKETRV
jgi:hypothetical protein